MRTTKVLYVSVTWDKLIMTYSYQGTLIITVLVRPSAFDFSAANRKVKHSNPYNYDKTKCSPSIPHFINTISLTVVLIFCCKCLSIWMQGGDCIHRIVEKSLPNICSSGLLHVVLSSVLQCVQCTGGFISSHQFLLPLENYYTG